ncbi:tyrosine-protein phosphatase non-receptor type 18 isoform X2 [Mobula hypostoma]|uniref:tyrosine-protein phosphatase non-receptor type 18 isoform X2 n=1 Tax=Mobula hypostoma TaxID=723540 RepID=UPI002FC2E537
MEERLRAFLQHLNALEQADGTENCFAQEFQSLKRSVLTGEGAELSTKAGKLRENAKKNRYKDILPYDQTRVPLTLLTEEGYSDYINANFIRGADGQTTYIATQGPLGTTVIDLWRMIWEFHVTIIVMACREVEMGKRKCERYWATDQEPVTFGPFIITNVGEEPLGNEMNVRTLSVSLLGETRTVVQFQYLAWPDHGIPDDVHGLLQMIELIHQQRDEAPGPICVHCSAGCGRTGVICTVDYVRDLLLNQLVSEEFTILDIVREMRRQRPAAVQTKDQYHFVYRIVAEMFRKELEARTPRYQNWKAAEQTQPEGKQPAASKPALLPKPQSQPRGRSSQPAAAAMSGQGTDTYAVVSRLRPVSGAPSTHSPSAGGIPEYVNVSEGPVPAPRCLYSNVASDDLRVQTPASPVYAQRRSGGVPAEEGGTRTNYTTVRFSTEPTSCPDGSGEDRAPSLPNRTADSFVVEDQDLSRASSFSSTDGINSGKLHNALRMAFTGSLKKASEPQADTNDGYEDISDIKRTPRLDFNFRVSKPKGPRDPPLEWAQYGR